MKKTLLILLIAFAGSIAASAQQMLIEKTRQENEIVNLDNLKQITFDGTTVNIEQTDGSTSSTTMGNIDRIYFGDFTAINSANAASRTVTYISANEIAVNSPAGTTVTIYSITGTQQLTTRINAQGETINIANLPQGIYILKTSVETIKFIKR